MVALDEFVDARLAEDELLAWIASPASTGIDGTPPEQLGDVWWGGIEDEVETVVVQARPGHTPDRPIPPLWSRPYSAADPLRGIGQHMMQHHPSRVTAEVAAGRKITEAYRLAEPGSERREALHLALRALAVGHADHEDYDPAWRLWSPDDPDTWQTTC